MANKRLVPENVAYLPREEWGAKAPVLPMREHQLTRITIHHTGTNQNPGRSLTEKMRTLQNFSQKDSPLASGKMKKAWADIPYHLYIGVNGEVAQGRELKYVGDSNTPYDPAGHLLVVVEGNFETEETTPQQLESLRIVVPALAERFQIAADSIGGHKDFALTSCPGRGLYAELPHLRELVSAQR
ncbi:hypothetical protein GCM10028895_31280 [Pontibacter rugosus]